MKEYNSKHYEDIFGFWWLKVEEDEETQSEYHRLALS